MFLNQTRNYYMKISKLIVELYKSVLDVTWLQKKEAYEHIKGLCYKPTVVSNQWKPSYCFQNLVSSFLFLQLTVQHAIMLDSLTWIECVSLIVAFGIFKAVTLGVSIDCGCDYCTRFDARDEMKHHLLRVGTKSFGQLTGISSRKLLQRPLY